MIDGTAYATVSSFKQARFSMLMLRIMLENSASGGFIAQARRKNHVNINPNAVFLLSCIHLNLFQVFR